MVPNFDTASGRRHIPLSLLNAALVRAAVGAIVALVVAGCVEVAGGVREYDPQEVQPEPGSARVDDVYVRRGVDVALHLDGLASLVEAGREFTVESVEMHQPFDEDCLVEPGEQPPQDCPVLAGPLEEDWRQSRERDAYVGQLVLRLDEPAPPPGRLVDGCPGLRDVAEVERLMVHVLVFGADPESEDRAYVFWGRAGGELVPCGPGAGGRGDGG